MKADKQLESIWLEGDSFGFFGKFWDSKSPVNVIAGGRSSGALWTILPLGPCGVRHLRPNGRIADSCPSGCPARDHPPSAASDSSTLRASDCLHHGRSWHIGLRVYEALGAARENGTVAEHISTMHTCQHRNRI